jgi:hypothetical protein
MRQPLAGAAGPPLEDGEQDPDVAAEATEVQALAQHRTGRSGYVKTVRCEMCTSACSLAH